MDKNKTNEVIEILNKIMEYELSGVVRYTLSINDNRKRKNKPCSIFKGPR